MKSRQIYCGSLAIMRLKLAEAMKRVKLKDILYRAAGRLCISIAMSHTPKVVIVGLGIQIIMMVPVR